MSAPRGPGRRAAQRRLIARAWRESLPPPASRYDLTHYRLSTSEALSDDSGSSIVSCPSFNTPSLTRSPPPDAPVVPAARFGIRLIRHWHVSAIHRGKPASFRRAFRGGFLLLAEMRHRTLHPVAGPDISKERAAPHPIFTLSGRLPEPAAPAAAGLRNRLRKRRCAPLPEGGLPERAAPAPGFRRFSASLLASAQNWHSPERGLLSALPGELFFYERGGLQLAGLCRGGRQHPGHFGRKVALFRAVLTAVLEGRYLA